MMSSGYVYYDSQLQGSGQVNQSENWMGSVGKGSTSEWNDPPMLEDTFSSTPVHSQKRHVPRDPSLSSVVNTPVDSGSYYDSSGVQTQNYAPIQHIAQETITQNQYSTQNYDGNNYYSSDYSVDQREPSTYPTETYGSDVYQTDQYQMSGGYSMVQNTPVGYSVESVQPQGSLYQTTQSGLELIPLTVPAEPVPLQSRIPTTYPNYYCTTTQFVPSTASILSKVKIPFGAVICPYPKEVQTGSVPTIQGYILRCRKCRTYMNPFAEWIDNGSKYRCNLCFVVNDVPMEYDYDASIQRPIDRRLHPELSEPVVEYIAPDEYMVRAPQPNVYCFILDVSFASIQTG